MGIRSRAIFRSIRVFWRKLLLSYNGVRAPLAPENSGSVETEEGGRWTCKLKSCTGMEGEFQQLVQAVGGSEKAVGTFGPRQGM